MWQETGLELLPFPALHSFAGPASHLPSRAGEFSIVDVLRPFCIKIEIDGDVCRMNLSKPSRKYFHVSLFIVILICFYPLFAKCESSPTSPRSIVEQYVRMDYDGKGLETDGWNQIKVFTTWLDGPGWDTVMVVDGYKIGNVKISGNKAYVPVQYNVVGLIDNYTWISSRDKNFTDDRREVNPTFELVKNNGTWLIESPQLRPHVSLKVALENCRTSLQSNTNSEDRKQLKATIKAISKSSER